MNTRSKIISLLREGPMDQIVDTLNEILDIINVKFDKDVQVDDLRGIVINKFNAYVFDLLRGILPTAGELITKRKLIEDREKSKTLGILTNESLDLAASYILDSKIGVSLNGEQNINENKNSTDKGEAGLSALQAASKASSECNIIIENEEVFRKDKGYESPSLECLRNRSIVRRLVSRSAFIQNKKNFDESFDNGDISLRETLNMMRIVQQYAKPNASISGSTMPGLHVIYGKTNMGKSKKLYDINTELLKRGLSVSFMYASEPHPFSVGNAKEAIDIVLKSLLKPNDDNKEYRNTIYLIDSLRDIVYLSGGLAAGGVSTTSYEFLTTLSAMCMSTNTTIITAINPTSDDDKVYKSLMHAITSSVTSLTELTASNERTTFRKSVYYQGYLDHYERIDSMDILTMLLSGKNGTIPDIDSSQTNNSPFSVRAQERVNFLGV